MSSSAQRSCPRPAGGRRGPGPSAPPARPSRCPGGGRGGHRVEPVGGDREEVGPVASPWWISSAWAMRWWVRACVRGTQVVVDRLVDEPVGEPVAGGARRVVDDEPGGDRRLEVVEERGAVGVEHGGQHGEVEVLAERGGDTSVLSWRRGAARRGGGSRPSRRPGPAVADARPRAATALPGREEAQELGARRTGCRRCAGGRVDASRRPAPRRPPPRRAARPVDDRARQVDAAHAERRRRSTSVRDEVAAQRRVDVAERAEHEHGASNISAARNVRSASEDASAQCRSSSTTSERAACEPGAAGSPTPPGTEAELRRLGVERRGRLVVGDELLDLGDDLGQLGCVPGRAPSAEVVGSNRASRLLMICVHGQNAGRARALRSSGPTPRPSPRAAASSPSSSASRVLPIPGSPPSSVDPPRPASAASRSRAGAAELAVAPEQRERGRRTTGRRRPPWRLGRGAAGRGGKRRATDRG